MLSKCYLQNIRTIMSCRIDRILHRSIILMHHEEIWTKRAHIMTEFVNFTIHNDTRIILMDMSLFVRRVPCYRLQERPFLVLYIYLFGLTRSITWLVFHEELFRLPASSQCPDILEMRIYIFLSHKMNPTRVKCGSLWQIKAFLQEALTTCPARR